jgi:hypothetical protein
VSKGAPHRNLQHLASIRHIAGVRGVPKPHAFRMSLPVLALGILTLGTQLQ